MPKPDKWEAAIIRKGNDKIWAKAWRRAQKIRDKVEDGLVDFFKVVAGEGINVSEPPQLGDYTPDWAPLSASWTKSKGHDDFYFHKGALESALLRKNTSATFGRPQVFLSYEGGAEVKVNAGKAAGKYKGEKMTNLHVRVVPFPKMTAWGSAEELTAGENEKMLYKLTGPRGSFTRPLISPFAQWYIHVQVARIMRKVK